jgi:hypothetical protein
MRPGLTSILAIGTIAFALVGSHPARAQGGPWCAQYAAGVGGKSCGFLTYQQCMADLRGVGGWCERNMFYRGPESAGTPPRSHSDARRHRRGHRPRD